MIKLFYKRMLEHLLRLKRFSVFRLVAFSCSFFPLLRSRKCMAKAKTFWAS